MKFDKAECEYSFIARKGHLRSEVKALTWGSIVTLHKEYMAGGWSVSVAHDPFGAPITER